MYQRYFKRVLDAAVSLGALAVLWPLLLILTLLGAVVMDGRPFFVQRRPGKDERIFSILKFRTMRDLRDESGDPLPDTCRITPYGTFLRRTSLDELPELLNVLKGDMSLVGPRPLVPQYLPWYTPEERRRHTVRPGLTGLAQISGRSALDWESRFALDVAYVDGISFRTDLNILLRTVIRVFRRENVILRGTGTVGDFDEYRQRQQKERAYDTVG